MELFTPRAKRARSISSGSSSLASGSNRNASLSRLPSPPPKFHRSTVSSTSNQNCPYICTLPPTCSQPDTATSYSTEEELERHQNAFHKWICRVPIKDKDKHLSSSVGETFGRGSKDDKLPEGFVGSGGFGNQTYRECGKVFPDERLLELHHLETHDPLTRERQHRGEKIFQCFIPPPGCIKRFLNPAARRKHLIAKHKYPQEYFFAITNHGLNQIAQQDGLAASLIRPRRFGPSNRPQDPQEKREANNRRGNHLNNGLDEDRLHTEPPLGGVRDKSDVEVDAVEEADTVMTELTGKMEGLESSLSFVPRGVRKKKIDPDGDRAMS